MYSGRCCIDGSVEGLSNVYSGLILQKNLYTSCHHGFSVPFSGDGHSTNILSHGQAVNLLSPPSQCEENPAKIIL